jgi:DHA1 family inner membrane transport protein
MSTTNSSRRALLALALASFGIGTTEFVLMGLLPTLMKFMLRSVTARDGKIP